MEGLSFGWEFVVIVAIFYGLIYFSIIAVNYFLVVSLAKKMKTITDKLFFSDSDKMKTAAYTILPGFLSAFCIYFFLNMFRYFLMSPLNKMFHFPGDTLFQDAYVFFDTGIYGYIAGMTCLYMTRFSLTNEWKVIDKERTGRMIINFFLWTMSAIILTYFSKKIISEVMPASWSYPLLITVFTYFFLRIRSKNKIVIQK